MGTCAVENFMGVLSKWKNPTIIDVGAQVGLYSLLAKFYPNSSWHSFEPWKFSFNLLNDNIKFNEINNVKTYNIGLSDENQEEILYVPLYIDGSEVRGGLNSIAKRADGRLNLNKCEKVKIKCDKLDNIIKEKVHIIKIDVEGYELNVLKGCENIIKNYKPMLQLEYMPGNMKTCGNTEIELRHFLNKYNYKKCFDDNMGTFLFM